MWHRDANKQAEQATTTKKKRSSRQGIKTYQNTAQYYASDIYIYQKYRWPAAHACCQNWQTGVNLFATHTHKHLLRKNFYARNTESTTKQTKHTTQTKSEMRRSTKKKIFWTQTAHTRSTRIRHRREWSRRKTKYTKTASQQIEATAVLWSYPTYTQHTSAPATSTYGNHKPNRG